MTMKQPLLMQAAGGDTAIEYSGLDARALLSAMYVGEGITYSLTSLKVTQRAAGANFTVDIAAGFVVITGDDVANQGRYLCESTAVENRTIPSPPGSGTRIHRVIARVKDKLHNGTWSTYEWTLEPLEDTGSGTPALPNSAVTLALVSVSSGQASVTDANITDQRATALTWPSRPHQIAGSSTRPGAPGPGETIYRTDKAPIREVWDGSSWRVDSGAATVFKERTTDLARTSTTTLADDTQLTATLVAATVYELTSVLIYTAAEGGDMKYKFVAPAGGAVNGCAHNLPSSASSGGFGEVTLDEYNDFGTFVGGGSGTGTKMTVHVTAIVWSGDGGTFKVQWAQGTSSGTATTMRQKSFFTLRPVGI